jgi:hypothetical protein
VPVRGLVLGSECLAQVLGEEPATEEPVVRRVSVPGAAFAVATLTTLAPWTTLGQGSGPFGAWSTSPRWSMLAAIAAVAGLLLELAAPRLRIGTRIRAIAGIVLGLAVVTGSALAFFRPPFPADSVVTPWIAASAGAVAAAAELAELRRRPAPRG